MSFYIEEAEAKNIIKDISYIINEKPTLVRVFRECKIYNDEGDAVIDIEEKELARENIRIWEEPKFQMQKIDDGALVEKEIWNAISFASSNIEKGDFLECEKRRFKVLEVRTFTHASIPYKKNLKLEELIL